MFQHGTKRVISLQTWAALVDARRLDYYHQLEREHVHLLVIEDASRGLEDVAAGKGKESASAPQNLRLTSVAESVLVRLAANFERNLEEVEAFLSDTDAKQSFDTLLEELLETVIPNSERFPDAGRRLLGRQTRSIEVANGVERLKHALAAAGDEGEIREYVLSNYLLLYARFGQTFHLLSIRHHRQLSFDFKSLWSQ